MKVSIQTYNNQHSYISISSSSTEITSRFEQQVTLPSSPSYIWSDIVHYTDDESKDDFLHNNNLNIDTKPGKQKYQQHEYDNYNDYNQDDNQNDSISLRAISSSSNEVELCRTSESSINRFHHQNMMFQHYSLKISPAPSSLNSSFLDEFDSLNLKQQIEAIIEIPDNISSIKTNSLEFLRSYEPCITNIPKVYEDNIVRCNYERKFKSNEDNKQTFTSKIKQFFRRNTH